MKHIVVGTAGHIDHGKSSLVEALTGTHPDRLAEEKRRGITIDLGFAFLEVGGVSLAFVDVPGHERFVRNMLAGVGGVDLVLLAIAADESIKPQTREHFDICRLLGIGRGIIALTKIDLVDADTLGLVRLEVEEFVRGSFLEGAPLVEVSSRTRLGLDRLKAELVHVASGTPGRSDRGYLRLPIDRAFAMRGFGTVVTGTLVTGRVAPGDELELFPVGKKLRVRAVHSGGQAVEESIAGRRTAVNLPGIEVRDLVRGMTLATPGRFRATERLDARIMLLKTARRLKNRVRLHFHQGTTECVAQVILLEGEELAPGASALVQLRLDKPMLLLPGDRFILRHFSPVVTIGGGVVLDNLAKRHHVNDEPAMCLLKAIESGSREKILAELALASPRGLELREVIARTGWLESDTRAIAEKMAVENRLRVAGEHATLVASPDALNRSERAIRETVEAFHEANPLLSGISREELKSRAAPRLHAEMFRAAIERQVTAGVLAVKGDVVHLAGRKIHLSGQEEKAQKQLEAEFEEAGLAAPKAAEVMARLPLEAARARSLLTILLREKVLIRITEELILHASALTRLKKLLAGYKKEKGERLSVPAFKELTSVSRKYAIPLLEYLDRERLTRRQGDERVIL
jgi:selenocysteine-specific elongation factor